MAKLTGRYIKILQLQLQLQFVVCTCACGVVWADVMCVYKCLGACVVYVGG